jgi:hypothetical protein
MMDTGDFFLAADNRDPGRPCGPFANPSGGPVEVF